jgi:outer membrane protein TolC
LADTLYDGGLRSATVAAAKAGYHSTVASYRQVVLAAFQDVEDNLISVRILKSESRVLNKAAADARRAVTLFTNQYKAGIVNYTTVVVAQNTAYTAEKAALDLDYLRMTSAVGLVKALGGGWDAHEIDDA